MGENTRVRGGSSDRGVVLKSDVLFALTGSVVTTAACVDKAQAIFSYPRPFVGQRTPQKPLASVGLATERPRGFLFCGWRSEDERGTVITGASDVGCDI